MLHKVDLQEDQPTNQQFEAFEQQNRARSKNYADILKHDILQRQLQKQQQSKLKQAERSILGEEVQKEQQQKLHKRLQKLHYEQIIQEDNLRLSQIHKDLQSKREEANLPKEHPFVKLVDQQDVRRDRLKEKFRYQNKVNEIQENIKKERQEAKRRYDRAQRQAYEQFVEQQFAKRDNSVKRLKLMHTERMKSEMANVDYAKLEKQASHQYLEYLQRQAQQKHIKQKTDRGHNKSVETRHHRDPSQDSSPSPAYLGTIPYNHDRKRQLEILDRKFGFDVPKFVEQASHKLFKQNIDRNMFSINPEYDHRQRVYTEDVSKIRSHNTSPVSRQIKLPQIKPEKHQSSIAVRTQGQDTDQKGTYKTVKSYNFITGTVNEYRVPQ